MVEQEETRDGSAEKQDTVMEENVAENEPTEIKNPYEKKDKNEADPIGYQKKRRKTNQDDTQDTNMNEMKEEEGEEEPKRWTDYTSSEDSVLDREYSTLDDKKNEKRLDEDDTIYQKKDENDWKEIHSKKNTSENPWMTDTRPNKVRFAQSVQKGYWAKVKFEIFGYHNEKDKNGNTKLYTFEIETIKDVLRAIMRKGKMIDETFTILPRGANDNRKIVQEESIEHSVKENNKSLWLEGGIKRYTRPDGKINEIRKTIKAGFNMDLGIRFSTDTLTNENIEKFIRDWQFVARSEPNTYLFTNEEDNTKKIRIHELILRPVQEEHVEEIAYILGSTSRNQDGMNQLIGEMKEFVEEKLDTKINMGYRWTTPDLGYMELTRLWSKARKEQDPKSRRAMEPSIMVIYMGLGNHSKKIRFDTIKVLMEEWGSFSKITTEKGKQVSNFSKLPGGNKGVLIPPIDTVTKEDRDALLTLYERHIENKISHNLWIQTNINDMDYETIDKEGNRITIREYILNCELVPGMYAFNGIIKYHDIWEEYPDKYYLVTNNVTGEASTKRFEQLTKEIIQNNPMATMAFQDATIGPMTAFSKERNEPSRLNSYKFNLKELVEDDKLRLRDIVIDGKNVMESTRLTDNLSPWNINENSSRTYTTAQITQSIIGMEITANDGNENDDLTEEEDRGLEPQQPNEGRPTQISQSPAGYQETTPQKDNEGFTMVLNKKDRRNSQISNTELTNPQMKTIQVNENIARKMTGGTINVTAGNTYNLLNVNDEEERKKEEGESIISIGQSQSSWSSSTDSVLGTVTPKVNKTDEESTSDLESIKPSTIKEFEILEKSKEDDEESEVYQLRKQFREIEQLLKLKDKESLQRRNKEREKRSGRGGRGGRGAQIMLGTTEHSAEGEGKPNKSKNE